MQQSCTISLQSGYSALVPAVIGNIHHTVTGCGQQLSSMSTKRAAKHSAAKPESKRLKTDVGVLDMLKDFNWTNALSLAQK